MHPRPNRDACRAVTSTASAYADLGAPSLPSPGLLPNHVSRGFAASRDCPACNAAVIETPYFFLLTTGVLVYR